MNPGCVRCPRHPDPVLPSACRRREAGDFLSCNPATLGDTGGMTPITPTEAAERLGISARRVREICTEHNIGMRLGTGSRAPIILTESDLPKIEAKRGKVGNPNFVTKPKKRRRK